MRVSKAALERLVKRLNEIKGYPTEPYKLNTETGKRDLQPLVYHLCWAYGGVALIQTCADGARMRRVNDGIWTKRELYAFITACLDATEISK